MLHRCPAGKIKLHVRPSSQPIPRSGVSTVLSNQRASTPSVVTLKPVNAPTTTSLPNSINATAGQTQSGWQSGVRFQLVQHGGSYKGEWILFYKENCISLGSLYLKMKNS